MLNKYLESVNYNMAKNSIFQVHKSEKSKNSGTWCGYPKYFNIICRLRVVLVRKLNDNIVIEGFKYQ